MDSRLQKRYSSSAVIKLLTARYGLNMLGIKKILGIGTSRYKKLLNGAENLNDNEAKIIDETFTELKGRYYYEAIKRVENDN